MTISRENELFGRVNTIRLGFAIERRLDANQLNDMFENDEDLRREYLDYFANAFSMY